MIIEWRTASHKNKKL